MHSVISAGCCAARAATSRPNTTSAKLWRSTANSGTGGEADVLQNLGHAFRGQSRFQQGADYQRQALAIFRELGDRPGESEALNSLGEALSGAGLLEQARAQHDEALAIARQIGDQYEQARAHDGLACAYHITGDPGQGRRHWQQALTLYTGLGTPEAGQVRARLTAADGADHGEPNRRGGRSG
jgi:tetratricopeptide (TPR) repeat protein